MSNRALSPVVATVLLLLVTLVLAGTIGAVTVQSASF
ncbi:archaellin/type IV pilin N-terminal domain-containing protein [Haladaptatus pallidirubidus]|nr:archaellin/type IV pilin N-terminal domain-containing protein [Haladaptatus pallidirubidus]